MKRNLLLLASAWLLSGSLQAFVPEMPAFTRMADPENNYFLWPEKGQLVWGDVDNNGYLDAFLISGGWSILYINENGTLKGTDPHIAGLKQAAAVFIDYNNDGNPDILITGREDDNGPFVTRLYANSGAPAFSFTEDTRSVFKGVYAEDHPTRLLSVVDFNNDGWPDVLVNGAGEGRILELYKNRKGIFSPVENPVDGVSPFPGLNGGSAAWGDIDRDGYMDFVVSGYGNGAETYLFRNNGDETFSLLTTLNGQYDGETTMLDINNDGYPDIIESGYASAYETHLYINNRDNTFTKIKSPLPVSERLLAVTCGDFNNDGWADIAESYNNSAWSPFTDIFYNNGDTTFTRQADALVNVRSSFISSADIDNDGNLDIYAGGYGNGYEWGFFLNGTETAYEAPSVPQNLTAGLRGDTLILDWDKSTDSKMPQDAIFYNVFLQKGDDFTCAVVPADPLTGRLKISGPQPFILNNRYTLKGLEDGTYTVGVQAVNHSRRASAFNTATVVKTPVGIRQPAFGKLSVRTAGGNLTIANNENEQVYCRLISMNGQTVRTLECAPGTVTTVTAPAGGMYLLTCTAQNTTQTIKIIL